MLPITLVEVPLTVSGSGSTTGGFHGSAGGTMRRPGATVTVLGAVHPPSTVVAVIGSPFPPPPAVKDKVRD